MQMCICGQPCLLHLLCHALRACHAGLGSGGGFERLHYMLETFFDTDEEVNPSFIKVGGCPGGGGSTRPSSRWVGAQGLGGFNKVVGCPGWRGATRPSSRSVPCGRQLGVKH